VNRKATRRAAGPTRKTQAAFDAPHGAQYQPSMQADAIGSLTRAGRGTMKLQALAGPEIAVPPGIGALEISGITADSREARPGWLFAALPGAKTDGARFIADAVNKGASAVLAGSGTVNGVPE